MFKIRLKKALYALGLDVKRISKKIPKETGDRICLPNDLEADLLIDVGVAGGTPWLYDAFPNAPLVLVEPLNVVDNLLQKLAGRDYQMFECAAGSEIGEVEINYDMDRPSLSSIYERTLLTRRNNQIQKRVVPIKTIDSIVLESKYAVDNVGLKIDTEGFELEVLKGAIKTLKSCNFVVCEASIEKRFLDSYNFSELISWMHNQGFILTKILRFAVDNNGVTRMADVLFEPIKNYK